MISKSIITGLSNNVCPLCLCMFIRTPRHGGGVHSDRSLDGPEETLSSGMCYALRCYHTRLSHK